MEECFFYKKPCTIFQAALSLRFPYFMENLRWMKN
nr:MAG TPA: hypothetical protein [Caudoviricetes sp.]